MLSRGARGANPDRIATAARCGDIQRPMKRPTQPVRLTHVDERGAARMVDVGAKPETSREATATAAVRMKAATLALVESGEGARGKGDVLATARLAGIVACKRAWEWIPLCHPVRVVGTDVALVADRALPGVRVTVTVRAIDRTGVEMEAMVGAAAAALTVYDMVKGVERGVEIGAVRLEAKSGGRSGAWRRGAGAKPKPALASKRPRA
jgi:cyclic pyranopterin phosphate synthase